jgi:hypothetical protein
LRSEGRFFHLSKWEKGLGFREKYRSRGELKKKKSAISLFVKKKRSFSSSSALLSERKRRQRRQRRERKVLSIIDPENEREN